MMHGQTKIKFTSLVFKMETDKLDGPQA